VPLFATYASAEEKEEIQAAFGERMEEDLRRRAVAASEWQEIREVVGEIGVLRNINDDGAKHHFSEISAK
jgi:hypothetical protein